MVPMGGCPPSAQLSLQLLTSITQIPQTHTRQGWECCRKDRAFASTQGFPVRLHVCMLIEGRSIISFHSSALEV